MMRSDFSLQSQKKFFPGLWSTAGQSCNWAIGTIANSLVVALIASIQRTIRRKLFMIALVDYRPEGSKFGKDFRMADVRRASKAEAGKCRKRLLHHVSILA
jgi:hypothetical protein